MAREAKKKNAALKEKLHSKYAKMRKVYRKVINSKTATYEEKEEAQKKLGQLPRRSCKTQLRNRCVVTGRCRGYSRKFGLSRIKLREMFCEGLLPGVKKASW